MLLFSTSLASFPHPHMMKLILNLYPWHNKWQAFQNFPRPEPRVRCGESEFIILVGLLSSLRNVLGFRFSWFISRLKSGSFLVSYSLPGLIKHIGNTQTTFWTQQRFGRLMACVALRWSKTLILSVLWRSHISRGCIKVTLKWFCRCNFIVPRELFQDHRMGWI